MKIAVDTGRCVGAGQCVLSAPTLFDQDEDGLVEVLNVQPDASEAEQAETAAEVCPSGTITLR